MLAGDIQAIRIDAANMTIYGLSPRGTASVKLHPVGRTDQYLRTARELLAGFAIGSPGGYPVYLQRWTRMGPRRGAGQIITSWRTGGGDLGSLFQWFDG